MHPIHRMRVSILTALLTASLAIPAAMAEDAPPPARCVSVTGTHVTRVVPDVAVWRLSVSDEGKELTEAKASNDIKLEAVMAAVGELGVAAEDVMSGTLNIRKEYHQDEDGHRLGFKHWVVSRSVTLKQRNLERFDEYFAKLTSASDMEVNFSLEATNIHDLRWENRQQAVRVAKEKAEAMVTELGAKLGPVLTLDEHAPGDGRERYMSNSGNWFHTGDSGQDDAVTGTFAPGSIEVRTTVYVTFEIE